jgi:hypothetical protein
MCCDDKSCCLSGSRSVMVSRSGLKSDPGLQPCYVSTGKGSLLL